MFTLMVLLCPKEWCSGFQLLLHWLWKLGSRTLVMCSFLSDDSINGWHNCSPVCFRHVAYSPPVMLYSSKVLLCRSWLTWHSWTGNCRAVFSWCSVFITTVYGCSRACFNQLKGKWHLIYTRCNKPIEHCHQYLRQKILLFNLSLVVETEANKESKSTTPVHVNLQYC